MFSKAGTYPACGIFSTEHIIFMIICFVLVILACVFTRKIKKEQFNKITKNCLFMSYKYSIDSFNELSLHFSIRKIINDKYHKCKYWGLDINLDATNITYIWE